MIITSFPFMIGFSMVVMFSGFVFGFPNGFFPVYLGCIAGAVIDYFLFRSLLYSKAQKFLAKKPSWRVIASIIQDNGFGMMVVLRLTFLPFSYTNIVLSVIDIPFTHFISSTAIGTLKIASNVYFGSLFTSFTEPSSNGGSYKTFAFISFLISMSLFIGASFYIYKEIEKYSDREKIDTVEVEKDVEMGLLFGS